ncbi:hypothetical protein BDV18DRAFT_161780 [Aspergillus unguis]
MQLVSVLSSAALVALASALPQAQTAPPPTGGNVILFDEPNFKGENITFAPDGECQSIFPFIESIYVPEEPYTFCQFFDNDECTGEGAYVTIDSVSEFPTDDIFPAVICDVVH